MTSAPLNYAAHQGIFKRFGLDITPTFVEGGSMLTPAIVGGSLDVAQNGYTPAIAAAVQGADIVIIAGIANTLPYQLVVKEGIDNAAQLKGKNVAISRYGSSTDAAADFALKHLGLTRKDVNVLQLGGAATRMAAAISGRVEDFRAISRHRRNAPARISCAGRSERRGARLSKHVVRHHTRVSQISSRYRQEIPHGDGARPFMTQARSRHRDQTHSNFLKAKDESNVRAAYNPTSRRIPIGCTSRSTASTPC